MVDILENQEFNATNLLSFRGEVKQADLENIGISMEEYITKSGAERIGNTITATFSIASDSIDIELLMPVNSIIQSTDIYTFKHQFKIVNAVVAKYKGHPSGLNEVCNQLNQYIIDKKMQPITSGYNVTRKLDLLNPKNTEVDVFVGINPNIL